MTRARAPKAEDKRANKCLYEGEEKTCSDRQLVKNYAYHVSELIIGMCPLLEGVPGSPEA